MKTDTVTKKDYNRETALEMLDAFLMLGFKVSNEQKTVKLLQSELQFLTVGQARAAYRVWLSEKMDQLKDLIQLIR